MRGSEIISTLDSRRTDNHQFVKWWRKEEDFLDYDLIDRFIDNTTSGEEIGGLDLLTMDEMWNEIVRVCGTQVKRVLDASGDKVEWVHSGKGGTTTHVCAYTPESLMEIFDTETRGNPVDS